MKKYNTLNELRQAHADRTNELYNDNMKKEMVVVRKIITSFEKQMFFKKENLNFEQCNEIITDDLLGYVVL